MGFLTKTVICTESCTLWQISSPLGLAGLKINLVNYNMIRILHYIVKIESHFGVEIFIRAYVLIEMMDFIFKHIVPFFHISLSPQKKVTTQIHVIFIDSYVTVELDE